MSRRLARPNKLALGLAVGTSLAVCAAAAGPGITPVEAVGAFAAAGVVGALRFRSARPLARPHTLTPIASVSAELQVAAPQARSVVAHPAFSTDAAA